MKPITSFQAAELTAPTPELRSAFAELRRELEILTRKEQLQGSQLRRWYNDSEQAGRLQRQLITNNAPKLKGANIHIVSRPVDAVSGDLHFVRRIGIDRVAMLVADSSGHGIAAGYLSATVYGWLLAQDADSPLLNQPSEMLAALHGKLIEFQLSDCEFMTAVYAVYDETARVLRWARAGAPYPVLLRHGENIRRLYSPGLPLGVEEIVCFPCAENQLHKNDTIVFYTDGLELLSSSEPETAGGEWLEHWVRMSASGPGAELSMQFPQNFIHSDDVTVLTLNITN